MGHGRISKNFLHVAKVYSLHLLIRENIIHACIFFVHDGISGSQIDEAGSQANSTTQTKKRDNQHKLHEPKGSSFPEFESPLPKFVPAPILFSLPVIGAKN